MRRDCETKWTDLLTGEAIDPARGEINFAPYQCRWISNRGA